MRKPLEVFALDEDMNRATGSIPYTSLIWTRRYYECGEFQMTVPANVYDKSWAYIYADTRPETGIVQKVEYNDSSTVAGGVDTVTVSGFFMESFLNRVTFLVEQPEQQKVELPQPKPVGLAPKDFPTIWRASNGTYVYKNKEGEFIDSTGKQVDGSSDWVEVNTKVMLQHSVDGGWVDESSPVYSSYDFAVNNEDDTVTIISWWGGTRTEDIVLKDDRGNSFFESGGNVYIACGAVNRTTAIKYHDTMDAWNSGEEGVRYKVVDIKGPWQRTDTMEPITESDSVDQLFKWVQRFCGNSFHYIEPTIEGIVKTLDPSLQYLGDFAYKTLQEVEASYRVIYSFTNNRLFFDVWQGYDRSQEDAYEPVVSNAVALISDVSEYASTTKLPQGYSELEYIESSGTQHIDTGVTLDNSSVVDIDYQMTATPADWAGVFGDRGGANYIGASLFFYQARHGYQCSFGLNGIGSNANLFGGFDNSHHQFHIEQSGAIYDSSNVQTFDGTRFSSGPAYLFGVNDHAAITYKASMRCYSFSVSGPSGSCDLVPARRDSDSVIGMYDTVSGMFLQNAGSGSFAAGPDTFEFEPLPEPSEVIVPVGYTQVEYIESDGAQDFQQYIDTGFVPNGNSRLRIDLQMGQNSNNNYRGIAVSRDANDNNSFSLFIKNNSYYMSAYGENIGIESWQCDHNRTVITKNRNVTDIGGVSQSAVEQTVNPNTTIILFDAKEGSTMTPNSAAVMRLYSCQIYDGDTKVRDFWPVKRDSDGAAGLMNVLSGEFYPNQGSRPFSTGGVVPKADWLNYDGNDRTAVGSTPATEGMLGQYVTVSQCGFTVDGKEFVGWNTQPDGQGTVYQPGGQYMLTSGADVLYAQWSEEGPGPGPMPQPGEKAPWAVFSDTWGTIYGYSASRDTSNYKNTCFVLYQYDEPTEWEEDGRPVMKYGQIPPDYPWEEPEGSEGWYIPYTTKRGYQTSSINPGDEPDIETYLDLRSDGGTPACDSDWSREVYEGEEDEVPETMTPAEYFEIPPMKDQYDQWPDALTQKGIVELRQNYCVVTNMDTGTVNTDGYMSDFDLGDKVDFAVSTVGLAEVGRIIEAEEVYESSGRDSVDMSINITVGDEKLNTIKKAQLASK